jgi:hypothetical protein
MKKSHPTENSVFTNDQAFASELSLELQNGSPHMEDYTPSTDQVKKGFRRAICQLEAVLSNAVKINQNK